MSKPKLKQAPTVSTKTRVTVLQRVIAHPKTTRRPNMIPAFEEVASTPGAQASGFVQLQDQQREFEALHGKRSGRISTDPKFRYLFTPEHGTHRE